MRSKLRSAVVTTALLTFVTATGLASSTHAPAVLRVGSSNEGWPKSVLQIVRNV